MARTGHRRRKRKFNGNQHPQKSAKSAKYDIENPVSGEDSNSTIEESKQSVSGRKIKAKLEVKEDKEAKPTSSSLTGYRLMDMEILADIFRLMCCNNCGESNIQLCEISFRRHGCASCLRLLCLSCGWKHSFYTSKKVSRFY